jgi:hypothetical protein
MRVTCPAHLILLALITLTILGEEYKPCSYSLCSPDILTKVFSLFSSVPPGKCRDSTLSRDHILSNSLIILSFDAIYSDLLTVSLHIP